MVVVVGIGMGGGGGGWANERAEEEAEAHATRSPLWAFPSVFVFVFVLVLVFVVVCCGNGDVEEEEEAKDACCGGCSSGGGGGGRQSGGSLVLETRDCRPALVVDTEALGKPPPCGRALCRGAPIQEGATPPRATSPTFCDGGKIAVLGSGGNVAAEDDGIGNCGIIVFPDVVGRRNACERSGGGGSGASTRRSPPNPSPDGV